MIVKQISIFIENKLGRLKDITDIITKNNVDIRAISISDTTDFGILRIIVNDTSAAEKALKASGVTFSVTEVISVSVPDEPGGLNNVVTCLSDNSVSIEYMYAFLNPNQGTAFLIIRVDNNNKAIKILSDNNIAMMTDDQIKNL